MNEWVNGRREVRAGVLSAPAQRRERPGQRTWCGQLAGSADKVLSPGGTMGGKRMLGGLGVLGVFFSFGLISSCC